MKRLFSNISTQRMTGCEDLFDKLGFWIIAVKTEDKKLYTSVTDGVNSWYCEYNQHPDIKAVDGEDPGVCDNADAVRYLNERGWTCYIAKDDGEMYHIADFIKDLYLNAMLPGMV